MTNEELARLSPGDVLKHTSRLYDSITYWIIVEHRITGDVLLECVYDENPCDIGRRWATDAPNLLTLYVRGDAHD